MHELEDERPIPLGRAATDGREAVGSVADANRRPLGDGCPRPAEPTTARPASADVDRAVAPTPSPQTAPTFVPSHIERTRPEPRPDGSGRSPATVRGLPDARGAAVVEPPVNGPQAVVPPAGKPAVARPGATEPAALAAPGGNPLAALRGFRMEVEPLEPVRSLWLPALIRFAVLYVVVLGSVLVLISLFVAFVAQAGSGHP